MSADKMMPRDKALKYGIESLDNNELLALIIKSAYNNKNVFELVDDIFEKADGFANILSLSYEELTSIKGIKKAKAMEILAILEISKRLSRIKKIEKDNIDSIEKAGEWIRYNIAFNNEETFFGVFMNSRGEIIKYESLFKGNKNSAAVGVDALIRKAILLKAHSVIVAHNHPSESMEPSTSDIRLTTQIKDALKLVDIRLLDHIIVAKSGFFSFKKHNLL